MNSILYHPAVRLLMLFAPLIFAGAAYYVARWKRRNTSLWVINCLLTSAIGLIVLLIAKKLPPFDPDEPYTAVNSQKPVPPGAAQVLRDRLGMGYFVVALLGVILLLIYNMVKA